MKTTKCLVTLSSKANDNVLKCKFLTKSTSKTQVVNKLFESDAVIDFFLKKVK